MTTRSRSQRRCQPRRSTPAPSPPQRERFSDPCLEIYHWQSDSAGPYPETLSPLSARGDGLQTGVLALVRQVHAADDRGQRLEADEFARLPGRRRGKPDRRDRVLGSEERLHDLALRFDREVRTTFGVALQVCESIIQDASDQGQRIGNVEGPHLAG